MKKAVIFIGIPACGKTTFYKQRFSEYIHISLDELHSRSKESRLLSTCIESGQSFVVDNTNPTKADRERYITIARAAGYTVIGYYFRSSIGESLERNAQRTGKARVPDVAVASIHAKLELPEYGEGFDELYYVHIGDNGFIVDEWQREGEG